VRQQPAQGMNTRHRTVVNAGSCCGI